MGFVGFVVIVFDYFLVIIIGWFGGCYIWVIGVFFVIIGKCYSGYYGDGGG